MYYDTNCTCISPQRWKQLMKGAKRMSYKRLVRLIKEQLPEIYEQLALAFPNPWSNQCKQTATHYILVHSMIEHFIHK